MQQRTAENTATKTPRQPKLATLSSRWEKKKQKTTGERQRERGGESSRPPFDIKLDGEMENRKKQEGNKKGEEFAWKWPALTPHPQI